MKESFIFQSRRNDVGEYGTLDKTPENIIFMELLIKKSLGHLVRLYKSKIRKDPRSLTLSRWLKDEGESSLRLSYLLTETSIVFDIGGYRGTWSEGIINLYNPYVYIFEPIPQYYSEIVEKFRLNHKVQVYNFGLSDKNVDAKMALLLDASTIYKKGKQYINIKLRDINEFIGEAGIERIDLIKINIEGGEYPLLDRLINSRIGRYPIY